MRLLLEILVIGALIYLGWGKPLREWVPTAAKEAPRSEAPQPTVAGAPPSPPGAWMWDPNHHGTLDRPTPSPTIGPSVPQLRGTPTHSGAWMWDPNHHGTLDRPTPSPTGGP